MTRAWHAALLTLVFMLPFELRAPWLAVRDALVLTNLELLALCAVALWLMRQLVVKEIPAWHSPLTLPVITLLGIMLLASALAPADSLHAFKVTARYLMGAVVCWMMLEAVRSGLSSARVMQASVFGAVLVALTALLEVTDAALAEQLLTPFRAEPSFRVGGEIRASATLAYPTITALYLEMNFFFAMGWLSRVLCGASATRCVAQQRDTGRVVCSARRPRVRMSPTRASPAPLCGVGDADDTGLAKAWAQRRWLQSGLLAGALLLISAALILTLTRSALIAVLLAVPVVLIARWPRARVDNFARIALSATTCLGLLLLAASFVSPLMQLRLFSVNDRNWYRAAYAVPPLPPLKAGETLTLSIVLHNVGQRVWESDGPHATFVLYHWLSADGKQMIVANGLHSPLPRSVKPGETIELKAHVRAPDRAGEYVLAWDMLRDGLFWFSVLGAPMHELRAQVLPGEFNPPAPPQVNAPNSMAALNADRATLWSAALKMLAAHPWLGVGPGNFRLQFGPYLNTAEWDNRLHANNTYLELFADAGLLGGLAFLFFVLMIVRSGWRVLQVRDDAYGAALVGALAAFFIHAATDYFLEFTPTYLLFWLTLGLLLAHHRQTCEVYAVSDS